MKKILFILGFILSFAILFAQNFNASVKKHATERMNAPKGISIVLWDNTNINVEEVQAGGTCSYWGGNDNWAWAADDFDADEAWIIEKITSKTFSFDPAPLHTDKMAVVIYLNDPVGCKPGEEIYRNVAIPVDDMWEPVMILPEPFTLPGPGKYWITIASSYDISVSQNPEVLNNRVYITRGTAPIGCNYHYYDKGGLFTGYPKAEWMDASLHESIVPTLYSTYFLIEGDPNIPIDCNPVTNLKAVPAADCSKVELTWTAPAKGDFKYIIYRDGDEIDVVETEAYTDITFEPTLPHSWDIVVECDGYSPSIRVTLPVCKEPDCSEMPKVLRVDVTELEDHCETLLEWYAPTYELWNNVRPANYGIQSNRWMMETASRLIVADDFVVPAGETWIISEVFFRGFYNDYEAPDFAGIEIYKDDGNKPGENICEEPYLIPIIGSLAIGCTVLLPTPVVISEPGRYWISMYGTYDTEDNGKRMYLIHQFETPIGSDFLVFNEEVGFWEPTGSTIYYSVSFSIYGKTTPEDVLYNIYRDGTLIEANVEGLSYLDTNFEPNKEHTWSVKTVCPNGNGVSAPVYSKKPKCKDIIGINENNTNPFYIFPNPTSGNITINSTYNFNAIEVINFLGQKIISQSNINHNQKTLDVSNLNSGVYFIRIISETGISVQKFVKQ